MHNTCLNGFDDKGHKWETTKKTQISFFTLFAYFVIDTFVLCVLFKFNLFKSIDIDFILLS